MPPRVLHQGRIADVVHKSLLPTYDVFDEDRYFEPADETQAGRGERRAARHHDLRGHLDGRISAASALRCPSAAGTRAPGDRSPGEPQRLPLPPRQARGARAHDGRAGPRTAACPSSTATPSAATTSSSSTATRSSSTRDGGVLGAASPAFGGIPARGRSQPSTQAEPRTPEPALRRPSSSTDALVLGLRDYVHKCGFKSCVLGLSGGIDSALIAVHRRRRARPGERPRRLDAQRVFVGGQHGRCARPRAEPRHPLSRRSRSRRPSRA